ncbi:MAG: BREX-1 system adenine-specific DNA-methyltransferase PglX [Bacteroidaceae bacterium]|nr:BREX-1 system adenine-specific DNA-methyltransferase PglX [Bacteroidaceae bacterium]
MDTNRIKKFASEARNILKKGIAAKITSLGFDSKGNVQELHKPQLMQGGSLWNGQLQTEGFYHRWMALYSRVCQKGIKEVYEEAAYTWFNRLMAIRILQKNGLCEGVMDYADAARTPQIVNEARTGSIPQMTEENRRHLMDLLDDDTKVTEQFALLITAWCQQNAIIAACFGGIADYTELLLPNNILAEGGFVDMINHTEFITDEEYHSPELIGWLYQFYISERKDEVFAKKGKFEADEIPAATQIFTPNWIVKYMVQNTVGRIYLDNNPWTADEFKPKWKYLVEPSEETPQDSIYRYDELTDLKVADLACGSGHILNECFDLLYDLYISEGYSRREAIENIFHKNLTGIDLDTRAKQMATFALLLKASQKDQSFADAHVLPHVLSMPQCNQDTWTVLSEQFNSRYGLHCPETSDKELSATFTLMEDADSLGSIMKFRISDTTRLYIQQSLEQYHGDAMPNKAFKPLVHGMELVHTLTEKYSALVMNPPYMGSGNMNSVLSKYVKDKYEEGKADLFSTFMILAINRLASQGKYGMINMHSWMFLSSFEKLRNTILNEQQIDNLLHLGPRTFDELSGEVVQNAAFVITKKRSNGLGIYYRLVDGKDCSDKERMFLNAPNLDNLYYPNIPQKNFEKIPGCPIGYWVSEKIIKIFTSLPNINDVGITRLGMTTGENARFVRLWHEVNSTLCKFDATCQLDLDKSNAYFVPYNKGGSFRKWYGNNDCVLYWKDEGYDIKHFADSNGRIRSTVPNTEFYFLPCASWSKISSGKIAFRYKCCSIFDVAGACYFAYKYDLRYMMGFLNSNIVDVIIGALSPTLNYEGGQIASLPICYTDNHKLVENIVAEAISLSQSDWDSHETSWDFEENPLTFISKRLDVLKNLAEVVEQYKEEWTERFMQLHANEEELNRQFIDIYGLQDELTPDVPLDEITILQQGEIKIEDNQIKWNNDVLMKQLISYAVGVWMGRYRLDKPGLNIAHPEPTDDELAPYTYQSATVNIDDDGIIPILPQGCPFDDNLPNRIADFIRIAFGEEHLTENLNYMEKQLGMSIEQYLLKDFWKDHKKMYQNRPIYWLFSSKKGAFKCITYMHRMDAYTAERVRSKYLLPYIEMLQNKVNDLSNRASQLSTTERRQLDNMKKTLEECNEYHDRLQVLAEDTERTTFDLDDGVIVNYAKYGDVLAKIK